MNCLISGLILFHFSTVYKLFISADSRDDLHFSIFCSIACFTDGIRTDNIHMVKYVVYRYENMITITVPDDIQISPHYWSVVRGIHWPSMISPQKGPTIGSFTFSFLVPWKSCWYKWHLFGHGDLGRSHFHLSMFPTSFRLYVKKVNPKTY